MTGWPRLSDNFCPKMRAMMSLPPPAAKPTTIWIGRDGYFDGSSCAHADVIALAVSAIHARYAPIRKHLLQAFMDIHLLVSPAENASVSKPGDVDVQHGGLAVVQRGQAAVDGAGEIVRLRHAFAVCAECTSDVGIAAPLALTARCQPRLKLVGLGRDAFGIDA